MKLRRTPDIHDQLSINGKVVKIDGIRFGKYNTSGEPKIDTIWCSDKDGKRYQFIIFEDMTVSKVHEIKQKVNS